MSNYFSQQEENFWPCVSDMFLALFIIALALFSQASDREKNADIRQEQLMADETCRLIETLSEAFPNDSRISSLKKKTEKIRAQHSSGDPCKRGMNCEMNNALTQLPQSESIKTLLGQQPGGIEEFENRKFYHSDAVNYLYKFVIPKEERRGTSDDARLSQTHQEILRRIVKDNEYKIKILSDSKDKDKGELQSTLAEAKADSERKDERIGQLQKDKEELQTKIDERDQRIAAQDRENKKKDEQIDELKERLGEDMRPRIMDKLKKIIDDTGCSGLVKVDRETGVLSIPSGTLVFKDRNKILNPYKPFANQTSEENLKKIAEALDLLMEEDSKEHLVDTIIIEGHADPHVRGGPIFEYANDEASAWRALGTWLVLNSVCSDKFKGYKNANNKAIFGIAGYGSRNCPARGMNETDTDYKNRCRRIDIRFIPAPRSNL